MKPTYVLLLLAVLLVACNPLKEFEQKTVDALHIGVLGKEDNNMVSRGFRQVGKPVLTRRVALSVEVSPFTKDTFKDYKANKEKNGENPQPNFVDSIKPKPKYVRLRIKDKIMLRTLLNNSDNEEVKRYLASDPECKIISGVSLYVHPMIADNLERSDDLFLYANKNGSLQIDMVKGGEKQQFSILKKEIFSYELMGFCWSEDVYGNARIETLNEGGNCPDGTEKSARKIEDNKSYLKL